MNLKYEFKISYKNSQYVNLYIIIMGSKYMILAPHCEHNETGCYIIDAGYFFFF
jgi:hypothetical protein